MMEALLKFVTLLLTLLCAIKCAESGPVSSTVPEGFSLLGQWEPKNVDRDSRALTYYISDAETTQAQALGNCFQLFNGRLVTILNEDQLGDVLVKLLHAGLIDINLWTAGGFDGEWKWITTSTTIESSQLIWRNDPGCGASPSTLPGLQLSQTGFCNYPLDTQRRYICEI